MPQRRGIVDRCLFGLLHVAARQGRGRRELASSQSRARELDEYCVRVAAARCGDGARPPPCRAADYFFLTIWNLAAAVFDRLSCASIATARIVCLPSFRVACAVLPQLCS